MLTSAIVRLLLPAPLLVPISVIVPETHELIQVAAVISLKPIDELQWYRLVENGPPSAVAVLYTICSSPSESNITGISYGVAADIDLDDPAGLGGNAGDNAGVINEDEGWVGGVSGESDTLGNFSPYNTYMAVFHLPADGGCNHSGDAAGQVLANPNYVHPENSYNTDSLYALLTTFGALGSWGSNIHIDTGQAFDDISVLLVSGYNQDLNVGVPLEWGYGIAVSDVSTANLTDNINALRAVANASCQVTCLIEQPGDVNVSGGFPNATDIIYLVNYVFGQPGPPEPLPCAANGDVNCSGGFPNATDIIYLVNYVFGQPGPPDPCDICNSPNTLPCVP